MIFSGNFPEKLSAEAIYLKEEIDKMKKTIAAILMILFILTLLTGAAAVPGYAAEAAVENTAAEETVVPEDDIITKEKDTSEEVIRIMVPHINAVSHAVLNWEFPYADDYFRQPSDEFSRELAKASLGLMVSAFRNNGQDLEDQYAGLSRLKFYLTDDEEGLSVLCAVRECYPMLLFRTVEDSDWENNWREYYKPIDVGEKLVVVPEWEDILMRYRAYGINCMRFHSHTPPEAAFTAADRLGMLMQPELSCWNPTDAFEQDEAYFYYRDELVGILRMLSNHPSFVMLSLGNELHAGEKGHRRMDALLHLARGLDPCRLYANGSNVHYGAIGCDPESDFFASQKYYDLPLRGTFADMEGHINEIYPSTDKCYDEAMAALRKDYRKPVISFEVGQFEVLPDFQELPNFQGVTIPGNYRAILERAEKAGISKDEWRRMVEATGTLSRICYREEAEAALRTEDLSGISFLGLQDFPGQGTALVGMMNAHLQPKPYDFAKPEHFAAFLRPILPLALLPRYTYFVGDEIPLLVKHANYSEQPVHGPLRIRLLGKETAEISREDVFAPPGGLTSLGTFTLPAPDIERACALSLEIRIGNHVNTYPLWVYPKTRPVLPPDVYETRQLDDLALDLLRAGKKVFLAPDSDRESMPHSIKGQFSTDFWSVGTFPSQEGGMGQLIDETHPVFRDFPTSFHTDWQWWPMASQRALILPRRIKAIVAELDSFAFLRPMAQLFECWVGKGRLFFSSLGLHKLQQYPEATALLSSIYRYTGSPEFEPTEELTEGEAKQLL